MFPPLLMIFLWPVVTLVFFKRFEPAKAVALSLVLGALFLPPVVSLDLPLLPPITKHTMPSIAAVMCAYFLLRNNPAIRKAGHALPGIWPKHRLPRVLLGGLFIGAAMTVLTNRDTLVYGPTVIPGLRLYDVFSSILASIMMVMPMLLARKYLAREQDHEMLLKVICGAALVYSFLALIEVRMSPQLNVWVYGFFAHDWFQHVRGGGFRPLVFLNHGLWLGIFLAMAIVAAGISARVFDEKRTKYAMLAGWLLVILFMSKALGSLMIAMVMLPVIFLLGVRWQMLFVAGLSFMVLFYPMLRGSGVVPVDRVVSFAQGISVERADSLQFRLDHEDDLLGKAEQRPFFGWGNWGRNRIYNDLGMDVSVVDGQWVGEIGRIGWFGYICLFGLLTLPIFLMAFRQKNYEVTLATSGLCLILGANMVDMLPNASMQPMTWLLAGAIIGRLETRATAKEPSEEAIKDTGRTRPLGYSRQKKHHIVRPVVQSDPASSLKYQRRLSSQRTRP